MLSEFDNKTMTNAQVLFKCEIPGPCRVKKNGQKVVNSFRFGRRSKVKIDTPQFSAWKAHAVGAIIRAKRHGQGLPLDFPIHLKMLFYFKNHANEADLSNLYEGPQDVLKTCGIITDDRLVYSHDGSRKIFNDPNPRTEIEIFEFKE